MFSTESTIVMSKELLASVKDQILADQAKKKIQKCIRFFKKNEGLSFCQMVKFRNMPGWTLKDAGYPKPPIDERVGRFFNCLRGSSF